MGIEDFSWSYPYFSLPMHLPQYIGDYFFKRSVFAVWLICFIGSQGYLSLSH